MLKWVCALAIAILMLSSTIPAFGGKDSYTYFTHGFRVDIPKGELAYESGLGQTAPTYNQGILTWGSSAKQGYTSLVWFKDYQKSGIPEQGIDSIIASFQQAPVVGIIQISDLLPRFIYTNVNAKVFTLNFFGTILSGITVDFTCNGGDIFITVISNGLTAEDNAILDMKNLLPTVSCGTWPNNVSS